MVKQTSIRIAGWIALWVWWMMLPACTFHQPDEDWERNGKVRLHLSWQGQSDYPSSMSYYFYKDGTEQPVVRRGSASGYEGTLPAGHYRVAVCNTDCEHVALEMDNGYEGACGKLQRVSILKSSAAQVACPGRLYGTGCDQITVGGDQTVVEELCPVGLVRKLELNIKVTGQEELPQAGISGRLTGVASSVHIPSGTSLPDVPAYMTFDAAQTADGVYTASLDLFGFAEGENGTDRVGLELTLQTANGEEITSYSNITKEVEDAFAASVSAQVILDLVVRYDEISGLTVTFMKWRTGNDGSGVVGPLEIKQSKEEYK